jgi:hypothetical protein
MIEEMQTLVDKYPEGYEGWERDQELGSSKWFGIEMKMCIRMNVLGLASSIWSLKWVFEVKVKLELGKTL